MSLCYSVIVVMPKQFLTSHRGVYQFKHLGSVFKGMQLSSASTQPSSQGKTPLMGSKVYILTYQSVVARKPFRETPSSWSWFAQLRKGGDKVLRQKVVCFVSQMNSIPKDVLVRIGAHRILVSSSETFEEVGSLVAWGCNWADRKPFLCSVC